ncbi:unnamed protein product [Linum trigynum]
MQKPLPTVVQVFHDLLQHEQKLKADGNRNGNKGGQSVALAAGSSSNSSVGNSSKGSNRNYNERAGNDRYNERAGNDRSGAETGELFCNYCKKTNHVIKEDCWRLKKKNQNKEGGQYNRFSGAVGHESDSEGERQLQVEVGSHSNSAAGGFTAEEIHRLRGLLQSSSSPTSPQSPAVNHRSHSVTKYLPQFPNYGGPSEQQDDWFGQRK